MLVLLGEVGGVEEYRVIEAVKAGKITKPIVAWAIGTCAKMFTTEVQVRLRSYSTSSDRAQFGHAGSMANSDLETADAKNNAMRAAGMIVPDTFEDLPTVLKSTYERLVASGEISPKPEVPPPQIPIDYKWAQELGMVRKPAAFISTISDERGSELIYAGMKISEVFKEDVRSRDAGPRADLADRHRRCALAALVQAPVAGLRDQVPRDGAHVDRRPRSGRLGRHDGASEQSATELTAQTVITTRAGKDLISSLCAGLLTIGDRFGGALDGAAAEFTRAMDTGLTPREFVDSMRRSNKLIPGIGHKVKSKANPDFRVELVKDYVFKHFPSAKTLEYALRVEDVTSAKKDTLILNVDGAIAVSFVDLLRNSGAFTAEEAAECACGAALPRLTLADVQIGVLNGLFVLGRSLGFAAHHFGAKDGSLSFADSPRPEATATATLPRCERRHPVRDYRRSRG